MNQLTIFDSIIENTANQLLKLLNEGRKGKDIFYPHYFAEHGRYTVLIACNKNKEAIGNILGQDGKVPDGFCVNWRNLGIIKDELKKLKIKL